MADKATEDQELELYRNQIQHLSEQVDGYKLKYSNLQKRNEGLKCGCSQLEDTMEFLPHYVKYITDESEKDVNELKERLNSELQAMIHDVEALKLQQMSEREELQDQVDELEAKYRMKDEMIKKEQVRQLIIRNRLEPLESLREKLSCQREENEAAVLRQQEEHNQQMMNLVKEFNELDLPRMIQSARAKGDLKSKVSAMHSAIKNQKVKTKMIKEGKDQLETDICKLESELSTVKENITELRATYNRLQRELKDKEARCVEVTEMTELLRLKLEEERKESLRTRASDKEKRRVLQRERARRQRLENVIQDAAMIVRELMVEPSEAASESLWSLEGLRRFLESTASKEKTQPGPEDQASGPQADRAETPYVNKDPWFLLTKYRRGDFGFIPRPKWTRRPVSKSTRQFFQSLSSQEISSSASSPALTPTALRTFTSVTDLGAADQLTPAAFRNSPDSFISLTSTPLI